MSPPRDYTARVRLGRRALLGLGAASAAILAARKLADARSGPQVVPQMQHGIPPATGAGGGEARLFAIGVSAPGVLPYRADGNGSSVLTEFSLTHGTSRALPLPFAEAHSLVRLRDGFAVIGNHERLAFLNPDMSLRNLLQAPPGWEFGGHGLAWEQGARLLVGLRPGRASGEVSEGRIAIVVFGAERVLETIPSAGFDPHDLALLPDGRVLTCNYGDRLRADLGRYETLEPSLGIFAAGSLALSARVEAPRLGSLSHLSVGEGGRIAFLPARLQNLGADALSGLRAACGGVDVPLSAAEAIEGKVGFPSPVLLYDPARDEWRSLLVSPARQRRPQSIAYHAESRSWLVTFPFSETIAKVAADGSVTLKSAFSIGLSLPRGVCTRAGDEAAYFSGQFGGIARVRVEDLEVLGKWELALHDATHLHSV